MTPFLFGTGDPAQRALLGFRWADDFCGHMTAPSLLSGIWLPGHFAVQSMIIKTALVLGISPLAALHAAAFLMCVIGIYCFSRAAQITSGAGWPVAVALLAMPIVTREAFGGLAEPWVFGLVGAGVLCVVKERYIIGALLMLTANTFRVEICVLVAAIALWLLIKRGPRVCAAFAGVAGSYMAVKCVYSFAFVTSNLRNYTVPDWHNTAWGLAEDLVMLCGPVLALLAFWAFGNSRQPRGTLLWGLLFAAFWIYAVGAVVGGVLFGGLSALRYMMFGVAFGVILIAACIDRLPRRVAAVIVVLGAVITYQDLPTLPGEFWRTVDYLNAHKQPGDTIAVDFAEWKEQPMCLYTMDPRYPKNAWCWSNASMHPAQLLESRPRYIVLTSEAYYKQIQAKSYERVSPLYKASYLRPIPSGYKKVFGNGMFTIWEKQK